MRNIDRARGCLVGAAVGDALGMPFEFRTGPVKVAGMVAGRLPAGSFTDDTEMALALAQALLVSREEWREPFQAALLEWYAAGPADIGMQTARALDALAIGEKPPALGHSTGNGSLMRTHVVAVAFGSHLPDCLAAAAEQSAVTHPHPLCVKACRVLSGCAWLLLHGVPARHTVCPAPLTLDTVARVCEEARSGEWSALTPSGFVIDTLRVAFWALLTTSSFEECVRAAVALGGDADTNGAVAGALAGAAYGLDSIPRAWRNAVGGEYPLRSKRRWNAEDLVNLADSLYTE
jgi:ADP-ribosyl-[dinitrogen reductase] hydrolase